MFRHGIIYVDESASNIESQKRFPGTGRQTKNVLKSHCLSNLLTSVIEIVFNRLIRNDNK